MNFIIWHYSRGLVQFLEIWKNFISFFWKYFGVDRHFFTLLSSWKRDVSKVGRRGLHPLLWLQTSLENILTRFLGAVVRSFTLLAGIFAVLAALIAGAGFLLIWLALPLFLFSIFFASFGYLAGDFAASSVLLAGFLLQLVLFFFFRRLPGGARKK